MTDAFNLDAILGENKPKPLTYKGTVFHLPGELPADVLTPFLTDDIGLIDLVTDALAEAPDDLKNATDGLGDIVMKAVKKRPALPRGLVLAVKDSFERLLNSESDGQYAAFTALHPTVPAYSVIAAGVLNEYGMSLLDFFFSVESSETESDGEPSKQTSNASTESTPEGSADAQETPDSSASGG